MSRIVIWRGMRRRVLRDFEPSFAKPCYHLPKRPPDVLSLCCSLIYGADFGFDSEMIILVSMPSTCKHSSLILNFQVRNDNTSYTLAA